jgi:hypothetical protein
MFTYRLLCVCDLAGTRTQDPILKRDMLYQLSYQVNLISLRFECAKLLPLFKKTRILLIFLGKIRQNCNSHKI